MLEAPCWPLSGLQPAPLRRQLPGGLECRAARLAPRAAVEMVAVEAEASLVLVAGQAGRLRRRRMEVPQHWAARRRLRRALRWLP
jgi:hypothetical protein